MTAAHAPIRAVLFDLDDTLNDRAASSLHFIPKLLGRFGGQMSSCDPASIHKTILTADRGGYRPKAELFADLCQQLPWLERPMTADLEAFWREHFAACTQERSGAGRLLTDI